MMLTRCPACGTTFRVTPEQLKARQGQVRCGQCRQVFNALSTLIEEAKTGASIPVAPSGAPATSDSSWAVVEPAPEAPKAIHSRAEPALPSDFEFQHPMRAPEPRMEPAFEAPTEFEPVPEPAPETPAAPEFVPLPKLPDIDFNTPVEPTESLEPHEGEPEYSDPETLLIVDDAPWPPPDTPVEPEPEPELVLPRISAIRREVEAESEHVFELHDEPAPTRRWPWVLGSVVTLLVLAGQLLLQFRTEVAIAAPESRPLLVAACQLFGCKIELPHKIEFIGIETSDLSPDGAKPGWLHLAATLRNRAPFAQNWPNLELTLTDAQERPLIRRVLAPADYLPAQQPLAEGFPRRGDQAVQLTLEAADVPAVGYRLYVFYP
jgi:predicted Zn finger-like uncharacterized protein